MKKLSHQSPSTDTLSLKVSPSDSISLAQFKVLYNGVVVLESFYESIKQQVEQRLTELDKASIYTAKQLCGQQFWEQHQKNQKISAGICISSMASTSILPLTLVRRRHEYPLCYRYIKP